MWRKGDDDEVQLYRRTHAEYQAKCDELWKQNWRIELLNQYVVGGAVEYDAVWRPGTTGEIQLYEMNYDAFRAEDAELRKEGWRLGIVNAY